MSFQLDLGGSYLSSLYPVYVPTVQEEGKKPQDATSMHPRQLCHVDDWAGRIAGNSTPVHSKCEFSGGFWKLSELGTVTILPSLIQKRQGASCSG